MNFTSAKNSKVLMRGFGLLSFSCLLTNLHYFKVLFYLLWCFFDLFYVKKLFNVYFTLANRSLPWQVSKKPENVPPAIM